MTGSGGVLPAQPPGVIPDGAASARQAAPGSDLVRLALVVSQLLVLLLVVRVFELENRTVFWVLFGAVLGFVVHASLPLPRRLPFFAALSVASVMPVLGLKVGAVVLGLGFVLIGVCHLPFHFKVRVGILLLLAAALMAVRNTAGITGLRGTTWIVLGSMFMFRLALYIHSVRHRDAPHGLQWSAAYLFMLPNVCFPLFPVVDYNTFVRTHFDSDRFRIYDRGVQFMVRGIAHLLVYRLVYYELGLDGLSLNTLGDVLRYVASTFFLYVKVSGQFWLIVGVLGLYGFRLPETNHLYFLASSPTDFWRRINIYWKDFMMKLVYYPSFFRLRRYGKLTAVAVATLIVFAVTWLLHGYQSYWLQGSRLLYRRDMVFWGSFAVLMLIATLWELRPGRQPVRKTDRAWSLARGLSTVATFSVIATLWSLWNALSIPTWFFMWRQVRYSTPSTWGVLFALVVGGVALAGFGWGAPTLDPQQSATEPAGATARRVARRLVAMASLVVIALPITRARLPASVAETVEHLRGRGFSPAGVSLEHVGYYELLTSGGNPAAVPWQKPANYDHEFYFMRRRRDFLVREMPPSKTVTYAGARFTTNSWGMRDREYDPVKPSSTYRIALFGPSDVVGWGVTDGQVFESLVETRLDSAARLSGQRAEILNFGTAASSLAQQVYLLETKGLRFSPDLIVLTVHPYDLLALELNFRHVEDDGLSIPDTGVARLAASIGVGPGLKGNVADLRVIEEDLDRRLFRWAEELGSRVGAPVAILALRLTDVAFAFNLPTTRRAIAAEGIPLLDCTSAWDGRPMGAYRLSLQDAHPNSAGHRLIADCLFDQLARNARTLRVRPLLAVSQ